MMERSLSGDAGTLVQQVLSREDVLAMQAEVREVTVSEANPLALSANESYKGYGYVFNFDKAGRIASLQIIPTGKTTAAYQIKYGNVRNTSAGNIAHDINTNATVEKKKIDFSLNYKNIEWNSAVKIDKGIPGNYSRMSARDLFSMFSN